MSQNLFCFFSGEPNYLPRIINYELFTTIYFKTGECGKSTILKQMQILHKGGFTDSEKKSYVDLLHTNVFDTVLQLCKLTPDLSILSKFDADILSTSVCFNNFL